jgi:hypothetical protein
VERPRWHNGYWSQTEGLVKEIRDEDSLTKKEIQKTVVEILEEKVEEKK